MDAIVRQCAKPTEIMQKSSVTSTYMYVVQFHT